MNAKLQWLRNKMLSLNLQGLIISNPVNIKYLTNIEAEGVLLLTRKDNIYITDARYIEQVHTTLTLLDEIIVYDIHDLSKEDYENFFMFCENVGFEENYISYATYKDYIRKYKINNFVETEHIIEKQRMIKDDEELENIKKACEITDNCFKYIISYIKPGMTERQIANEIEDYYKQRADGLAFDTIVASRRKFIKATCSSN
ncbi:MAG: aminopeptidase P family protein [Clostridia bacterium]|nr:aminopeptidase P family protein [Clostridia bacterium]